MPTMRYFVRPWTALALVLIMLLLAIVLAGADPVSESTPFFSCSHDTAHAAQIPLMSLPQLNATVATVAAAAEGPSVNTLFASGKRKLRFLVRYNFAESCVQEDQEVPTYDGSGGSTRCGAGDVLTPAKRARLDAALQASVDFLSSALYSTPTATLDVAAGVCPDLSTEAFRAENYDFVLFVTAAPQMMSGGLVLAWGRACASVASGLTARPVVGHINFVPSGLGTSTAQMEASLAAHEITHALGFTSLYATLSSYVDEAGVWQASGGTASIYRPALQKEVLLVRTPRVLKAARTHFACDNLDGVEIEDMGGGGTAGSHWKKRILFQEALVGVVTSVKLFYTSITLAFFEDAGFYTVDYSMAEDQLAWGYRRGCPFLYDDCKTLYNQYGFTEFCFDAESNTAEKCTFDHLSIGHCEVATYDSALPSAYQYFSGAPTRGGAQATMDYCPFRAMYTNGNCIDERLQDDRRDTIQNMYGNVFSPASHCVESNLITSAFPVMNTGARCVPATCLTGDTASSSASTPATQQLLLQIQGQTVRCPTNGSAGKADVASLYGIHGQVTCQEASRSCRGYNDSGLSPRLTSSGDAPLSFTPYTYSATDTCDARLQRCAAPDDALTALMPRCALFVDRAVDCFGRRCQGTLQEWLSAHVSETASPDACRTAMDQVALRCLDGWEGATALCRLLTDTAASAARTCIALVVASLTLLLTVW